MNVDHYIPITEKTQVINRRHVTKEHPILGEYILFAVCRSWYKLFKVKGIAGILLNDLGYPAQITARELEYIRNLYGSGVYRPEQSITGFRYGDQVMIKEGPFAFHVARYDGKTRKGDSAILTLFGREQKVVFKKGTLVPV